MSRTVIIWFVLVSPFFCGSTLFSVNPGRQPMAILGPDQGLPSSSIITMTQDSEGFLWFGTENGLLRYEGKTYRHYTTDDGLPASWVQRLVADAHEGIWVGTFRGLRYFHNGRFEEAMLGKQPSSGSSSHVAKDRSGRIWLATLQGVFVQARGTVFNSAPWKPSPRLFSLTAGTLSDKVYLACVEGIQVISSDREPVLWGEKNGLPSDGITLVAEDGQGRIWAGTGLKLLMKEPDSHLFMDQSHLLKASISPNSVPMVDKDGSLWIPTQNGALHIHKDQSEWLDNKRGLPFRWVRSIFRDREETLWVLGPSLAKLLGKGRLWNYSPSSDAFGEVVWQVIMDPWTQTLLVPTDDGAARMVDQGLEIISGTKGVRIKDLALEKNGRLWMVSSIGPTMWLQPGMEKAQTAPLGPLGASVNTIFTDSSDIVWLGHSRHGLLRWDPEKEQLTQELGPEFVGATALGIYKMQEDLQRRFWVGSSAGILLRDPQGTWSRYTQASGLPSDIIRGFDFLADGTAWLFFQEPSGITRIRIDKQGLEILEQKNKQNGLISNAVYGLRVDSKQQIWISTDQGVNRLSPPLSIGRHDGMISEDCAVGALLVEENRVWVGTASGLVRYDFTDVARPSQPVKSYIMSVSHNHDLLEPPFKRMDPIPEGQTNLRFLIASPYYSNEQALHFQIRLLGLEKEWRKTDSRFIHYSAIPGGNYRFEVQAAIGEEPFGPTTHFAFSVRPYWWKRWWAWILYSISAVLIMILIVQIRIASLAKSKAALEVLVEKRTRELSRRNLELSEALTNVKQLSGLLPICASCKKIRDDQGYWNQLETYISEHSDVDFTHSICPSCAQELYPQFYKKD